MKIITSLKAINLKKIITKKNILKLANLKITTICLLLLFILTLWGTFYQYNYGLYAAQHKFFYSWFFLVWDVVPFIGAKSVLLVLFINLLAATLRYQYKLKKIGILIIHYGLLFLILSSFYIHYFSLETVTVLEEGETLNYSLDYYNSEIAVYEEKNGVKEIASYAFKDLVAGEKVFLKKFALSLTPVYFYENSRPGNFPDEVENASGIDGLIFVPLPQERERTLPGGVFWLEIPEINYRKKVLLWEGEAEALAVNLPNKTLYFKVQRKHYPLPFTISLIDFKKEEHLGTTIAKSYQSEVIYQKSASQFPALISMNQPFRSDGYTLFQSSFSVDESGYERSVLATVKNQGYYLPYIASLVISFGLIVHFLVMLFRRRLKK